MVDPALISLAGMDHLACKVPLTASPCVMGMAEGAGEEGVAARGREGFSEGMGRKERGLGERRSKGEKGKRRREGSESGKGIGKGRGEVRARGGWGGGRGGDEGRDSLRR